MKIITLQPDEFDQFANKHPYRNFYQTSMYAEAMKKNKTSVHYIGIANDNDTLIGASILLYKEVFMGKKYAYAPRGILFDYNSLDQVKTLAQKLKKLLGKQGFMYLTMDPYIPVEILDKKGNMINGNHDINVILENLKKAGFNHKGFNSFFENEKARYEALVLLDKDIKDIYKGFNKQTRNKIQKAINSGIELIEEPGTDLSLFYQFVEKKHKRPLSYYQSLKETFKDKFKIFYAKLNTEEFVIKSKALYDNSVQENDYLNQQMQDPNIKEVTKRKVLNRKIESDKIVNTYKKDLVLATNLLKNYPDGLIVGSLGYLEYDNALYLLIEGFDQQYRKMNPNYYLKWEIIKKGQKEGFKYFNLNAITGDFDGKSKYYGLNEMKLGFNSVATEYIGEFDLIINPISYNLYKTQNGQSKL